MTFRGAWFVAASAIVVVALVAALWLRTWLPLLALPLVLLRPALAARGARRRDAAAERELAACRAAPEFSEADFETVLREQAPAHR